MDEDSEQTFNGLNLSVAGSKKKWAWLCLLEIFTNLQQKNLHDLAI